MGKVILSVENVSKQYRLGQLGTGTISHDLNRIWAKMRGKEDPYLTVGTRNDRSTEKDSEYVWSLRDINFVVEQGEVLGVIGRNGAGKSTLLKILAQVTSPTTGEVKMRGRIAPLLEVGTGFHPELTGKENIYLNGAILGMTKAEIKSKLDEIIEFSGVTRYVDTPVKRYSSGMMVRLGFAVAAHLEPEILIVDEVLAVGDAEFQKKCLGKMKEVSGQGRTVLFVSHNMLAIRSLCTKGLWLDRGQSILHGNIDQVIDEYSSGAMEHAQSFVEIKKLEKGFYLESLQVSDNGSQGNFNIDEDLIFKIMVYSERDISKININLFFHSVDGGIIFATCSPAELFIAGSYEFTCTIPANTLNDNDYKIDIMVVENQTEGLIEIKEVILLRGYEEKREAAWLGKFPGLIRPTYFKWTKKEIKDVKFHKSI